MKKQGQSRTGKVPLMRGHHTLRIGTLFAAFQTGGAISARLPKNATRRIVFIGI
jgi:hypothetical protein